ncbi:arylformamidase [Evansella halocellulosilytica]|uniref:arylformamidase n=1 Tax=Evansella halocellulosilytica TaxID=2011013 RepID=UPI0015C6B2D9|nr:arylformamidase [Evansella halocellulosilytica]
MSWIDISQTLNEDMDVWPGDTPFQYEKTMSLNRGDSVNVSSITMSSHTGTHMDAPYHYDEKGIKIDEVPLEYFHGETLVIHVPEKKMIERKDIVNVDFKGVKKVLFKTKEEGKVSYDNYAVLSPELAPYLKENNIHLIGIDSPSVDPLTSKDLLAHHALKQENILIIEGLQLQHVKSGFYELYAFPLKIKGGDGCPVRAVLKEVVRS